ncbi:MAG: CotH kinase family protein [Myxococcota bacterium]
MSTALVLWVGCTPPVPVTPSVEDDPTVRAPPGAPASLPAVLLNELLPDNESISTDEALEFDDWVELYNAGSDVVELAGWGLGDGSEPEWRFPEGERLAPGEHRVVWLDDDPTQGPLHATFALDADDDSLSLFSPDGDLADSWVIFDQPSDVVSGRFPSGDAFRASSIVATPGNANPVDPGQSQDPSDTLFPEGGLVRIDLTLSPQSIDLLESIDEVEVPAGIGFQGAYLQATLAIKGAAGSDRSLSQKSAFRVDLDDLVPGQRLRGLEGLTLNNMVQDPSGVHEMLGYALFREAGVPAPRVAHVELWLNGEYRGLYLNVESPDDQFLQRWFADPSGNLYEGAYGPDLELGSVRSLELDELGAAGLTDYSDLAPLVTLLATPPTEAGMASFEQLVDLDRTLPMLAGEVVLSHWDGYFYYPNNYRLYHEPATGKVTLLPWGLDQTFGGAGGIHSPSGEVARWCLGVPSCRTRYDLALWDMAERLAALGCKERVADVLPFALPLYAADTLREATPADMEAQASATVD